VTERFYLPDLVSNRDLSYFKNPTKINVYLTTIVYPHGIPSNAHYYVHQQGGHGIYNSSSVLQR